MLAEKCKGHFTCLGKNIEKYITFSLSIEREAKGIGKNGEEIIKTISCSLQFTDNAQGKLIIISCQYSS